ncbi:MAG TPA: HemK2/MTQ2 family protein methyltransferase [Chloroflexota bacterium]|jgi:release factor glutamine methyltransferase
MKRALWRLLLTLRVRLLDRRRHHRLVLEQVDGVPLVVLPQVFNPKLLRSGEFLVRQLTRGDLLRPSSRVLDLGSGSGAGAVAAARAGCHVVAVDINPDAVRCTRINALLNLVEHQVDPRQGDLFAPVTGERFDVVLFNPPYYRGTPRDEGDRAWRSPDVIERFAAGLGEHLTPHGHALLVLSSDGESKGFLSALEARGFNNRPVAHRDFVNEQMWIYQVARC